MDADEADPFAILDEPVVAIVAPFVPLSAPTEVSVDKFCPLDQELPARVVPTAGSVDPHSPLVSVALVAQHFAASAK